MSNGILPMRMAKRKKIKENSFSLALCLRFNVSFHFFGIFRLLTYTHKHIHIEYISYACCAFLILTQIIEISFIILIKQILGINWTISFPFQSVYSLNVCLRKDKYFETLYTKKKNNFSSYALLVLIFCVPLSTFYIEVTNLLLKMNFLN